MIKICFQNGPEAPEIVLSEEFETEEEAESRLLSLAHDYGTVDGAAAWIQGTKKPKHLLEVPEPQPPADSVTEEFVPSAPPAPEVVAAEAEAAARAEAEAAQAQEEAEHANAKAHAEAAEAEAAARAEAEAEPPEPEPEPEVEAEPEAEPEGKAGGKKKK